MNQCNNFMNLLPLVINVCEYESLCNDISDKCMKSFSFKEITFLCSTSCKQLRSRFFVLPS